ncbi:AraC-like ligand binding domain protein [Halomonas elongata]|uniref:AraC-like ligand binding domain protein n=1 Tax=Halomonas elongata TaxID=2746 RepID=A0A1B8P7J7_HALEL|nr:AraC family ligand binding domain-containing protein [Halomonas elongata]OBX38183.1 AraC-like ligand binding domain protein [Halomonas elongata]
MTQRSQFRFTRSRHVPGLTMLRAAMSDFSYDRHAHEEYAFGVTLAGRQDFFSSGEYHRSRPGTVIELNPDEVHDGQAGSDATLDYVMLYADPAQLAPLFASAAGRESASQFRAHPCPCRAPIFPSRRSARRPPLQVSLPAAIPRQSPVRITPHQYVLNCRVNAARSALDAGHELNDVVGRYGLPTLSHFNRRFKRIYA